MFLLLLLTIHQTSLSVQSQIEEPIPSAGVSYPADGAILTRKAGETFGIGLAAQSGSFTFTMMENIFFGPQQVFDQISAPYYMGRRHDMTVSTSDMPAGTDTITIVTTLDSTGEVFDTSSFTLTIIRVENPVLTSPTHELGHASNNDILTVEWETPWAFSGVAGYSYVIISRNDPNYEINKIPDDTIDLDASDTSFTTEPLESFNTWEFNIRTIDSDGLSADSYSSFWVSIFEPKLIESCDADGVTQNFFDPDEDVYVKGSGFIPSILYARYPKLYVVEDTIWFDGMMIPERVPGTETSVFVGSSGDVDTTLVWNSPLIPGKYDIVVDENNNGVYDQYVDALDDMDVEFEAGFSVGGPVDSETHTVGGANSEFGYYVIQTDDGGYIIAGSKEVPLRSYDAYLIKTNYDGNVLWEKTYGSLKSDGARCVQHTTDGGYIVIGYQTLESGDVQVYLFKTDNSGNLEWSNTFGNPDSSEDGYFVQQTLEGGYIVTGFQRLGSPGSQDMGDSQVYLLKVNSEGNEEWVATHGGDREERGYCVQQTNDGGYIITGYTWTNAGGYHDLYLVKTDSSGILSWERNYGGLDAESGRSAIQLADGGYVVVGSATPEGGRSDVYLIRTDSEGNELWNRKYGGVENDLGYSVQKTFPDDGFIIVGNTYSYGAGASDVYLVKTDSEGNLLWEKAYGGYASEVGYCVKQTFDKGYVVVGHTYSFGEGAADVLLIKIPSDFICESVSTQTGTGQASFVISSGEINDLTAVDEATLPSVDKPDGIDFPDGLFSFTITNVDPGETVTVYLELPTSVPIGSEYWKCHEGESPQWFSMPIGSDDGDNVISISLTDGGIGDSDGGVNGEIVDPGGLGLVNPKEGITWEIILLVLISAVIIIALAIFVIKRKKLFDMR
jgi:hypothetical protein